MGAECTFKVIKTPIKPGDEPPVARRLLGYEFYTRYPDSGRWREFNRAFGKEMEMEFWQVLDDLAQDLAQLIELINADGEPPPGEIGTKVTIYLAEATFDLDKDCAQLRRDLTARGYQVLPDQALPLRGDDLETVVNGYLERAELSIHPIGSYSGPIPECHDRPLEQIQNSLATARSQADQLTRLVWIPQGQEVDEKSDHGKFIAELEDDPNLNTRDELLKSTIEELKTVIQDKLNPKPPTVQDTAPTTTEFQRVYLIFDGCDRDGVVPLDDYLYEQGFEIITPSFDGEPAELERDHAEKLRLADGVIIYCAEADKAWLDACKLDLAKAPKPQRTSAIYLDAPKTRDKERFRTREVDVVIRAFDGFDATLLKPFVAQLIGAGQ